jgi:hypothetical protein
VDERDDWLDLPLSAEAKRFIEATRQASMTERETMMEFAAILCRCTPWYDYRNPRAPQESCVVHTTVMFDMKGGWT